MLQAGQTYIQYAALASNVSVYTNTICVAKCLLGCAQTPCVLHPLDVGCAIASLKVDRRVHHDLAQGERGSLVKNTDL